MPAVLIDDVRDDRVFAGYVDRLVELVKANVNKFFDCGREKGRHATPLWVVAAGIRLGKDSDAPQQVSCNAPANQALSDYRRESPRSL
jgi:hypothetical protein